MQLARDMLAAAGVRAPTPQSVREGEWKPVAQEIRRGDPAGVLSAVRAELDLLGEGRLAVVTARGAADGLRQQLVAGLPDGHGRRGTRHAGVAGVRPHRRGT